MVNWKTYKIIGKTINPLENGKCPYIWFELDGFVSFSDLPHRNICLNNTYPFNTYQKGEFLEIDNDKTRNFRGTSDEINDSSVVRKIGSSLTSTRNAMINASSANPTALAVTRDLADRVDRGEQTNFKYEIEDNGVKHSWIYKRN